MYNLFSVGFEALHNLISGTRVQNELAQSILQVYESGKLKANELKNSRMLFKELKWHPPLKRNAFKTFKNTSKSCIIHSRKFGTSVEVNRNILGSLLTFSLTHDKPIDIAAALKNPLSPVPLSLATGQ